ncbi:geranylgeranyl pyrophosphate synthetase, putative [Rhizoctonia solani AG-3 Rhs1AP]|uniref:Geranylgeranyl pyrophosphate synthetase, putative n=1 Tax=Rhizoctonia solani AG-3 Rhs1AP TaxID=1086054 RepID=X8JFF2_9AGAM|nr:geranylgeranyl pyrophosphate synthetase, putative [Rhizoctonia solani AG-3 Rhs1AP]
MQTLPKASSPTSKLLRNLDISTAHPLASVLLPDPVDTDCEIRDYQVLGSYNLLDSQAPTIAIPGQPRIWQEPSLPLQISPDCGYTFIDQNAWRCQESPLEPLFRSISVTQQLLGNTSFSLSEQQIDVVTDRNNLRKLNAMVRSMRSNETLTPNKRREFRIDAQLAPNGRTLLLTRYSDQLRQMISPGDAGYGTNFEHATTSNYTPILTSNRGQSGCKKFTPTSYHRVAKYRLADLNLLVRYEVDAVQHASSVDDLPTFEQLSLEQKTVETQKHSTLDHIVSGILVPQDRVMELKTGKLKWVQIFPQLYFSQTSMLKVGVHQNGIFSKVEDHPIDENYNGRAVESRQNLLDDLRFLVPLLKQMKQACQQQKRLGKPLAFFWSGAGPLQLYEIKHVKQAHILPEDVLESL